MTLKNVEDRGNRALLLIFVIGIGSTLPFNIFMNATQFFSEKLNKTEASDELKHDIGNFSAFIVTFMGMASTLPNIFLQLYNAIVESSSGGVKRKMYGSIIVQLICLGFVIGACFIDGVNHPYFFFYTLLLLAFLMNAAGGLYQNLSFALAAHLPMKYTNANITGSNVAGIISALATIISMAVSTNKQYTSVIFFIMAIFFTTVQLFTTTLLYKNNYYLKNLPENNDDDFQSAVDESSTQELTKKAPIKVDLQHIRTVFGECWKQLLNIFLTFYVSLIIFPAVQVATRSVNENNLFGNYFVSLFTFLNFNLFAMIGNAATFYDKFPMVSKEKVWIFVVLRFLFIPFFLLCNYFPTDERTLPVLIKSDTIYGLGGALLGFTSGYFSSLSLMYNACQSVSKPEYAGTAAKCGAFSLISGIFLGISSSYFLPYLVKAF